MQTKNLREQALEFIQTYGAEALTRAREARERDIALGGSDLIPAWDRLYTEILRTLREPPTSLH